METTRQRPLTFFTTLGRLAATRQQENQFSRTFQACFAESTSFRSSVVGLLNRVCGAGVGGSHDWECLVEQKHESGGRLDIVIKGSNPRHPEFVLESKVGSELTLRQLLRTRSTRTSGRTRYLIAITKRRPEVTAQTLRAKGIHAIRWQDVHHTLKSSVARSPAERFLAKAFKEYLEETGMAYDEDLTPQDLKQLQKLFAGIAGHSPSGLVPKTEFDVAHRCVRLLRDLSDDLRDRHPQFAASRRWGPGYYNWDDPHSHVLGFQFFKPGKHSKRRFACELWFPLNRARPIQLNVYFLKKGFDDFVEVKRSIKGLVRNGALDRGKMLTLVSARVKQWKVAL